MNELPGLFAEDLASTALALAGRFAAGATLWCVSPTWPSHAHHVAVEFVHPVIVGKRALPAVVVAGPHVVDDLRVLARAGDMLLAVAPNDDVVVTDALRRARAWGLTTVWIGSGAAPSPGAADYVLWVDEDEPAHGGGFVLAYHLLWELTHVCFEHPGLLSPAAGPAGLECTDIGSTTCVTCSDEGRLGEVVTVGDDADATVRTPDGVESVDTTLVEAPHPGDLVLIHAGTVVTILDSSDGSLP